MVNNERRDNTRRSDDKGAKELAEKAIAQISAHEQLCAERWGEIKQQMTTMREILLWAAKGLIGGMILLLITMIVMRVFPASG